MNVYRKLAFAIDVLGSLKFGMKNLKKKQITRNIKRNMDIINNMLDQCLLKSSTELILPYKELRLDDKEAAEKASPN